MTTQEQIADIQERRYNNFKPKCYKDLKRLHDAIRYLVIPYSNWQIIKKLFGFPLPPQIVIDNSEEYLKFLLRLEREFPKPKYEIPEEHLRSLSIEITAIYFRNI